MLMFLNFHVFHISQVPTNNRLVKERAGSSLVDLESELETIGQVTIDINLKYMYMLNEVWGKHQ